MTARFQRLIAAYPATTVTLYRATIAHDERKDERRAPVGARRSTVRRYVTILLMNNTLAWLVVKVSFAIVLVVCAADAWVRWAINQNFTFLGGFELEVITVGAFLLLIALIWKRSE